VGEILSDNGFAMLLSSIGHILRANLAASDAAAVGEMQLAGQWQARFKTQCEANYSREREGAVFGALLIPQVASVAGPSMRSVLGAITAPPPSQTPCNTSSSDGPVQPNGGPTEASLIKKVQPVHSLVAQAARVQGSVEFHNYH
jgi:hypothetical protein